MKRSVRFRLWWSTPLLWLAFAMPTPMLFRRWVIGLRMRPPTASEMEWAREAFRTHNARTDGGESGTQSPETPNVV